MQHEIDVEDTAPIRQQSYCLPEARKEAVKNEIDKMLTQGIVQPSCSPWASPIVLVEKKLFSQVGIPDEILTDQGTNFMSALLQEIYRLLHIQ